MTIAVDLGRKATKQTKQTIKPSQSILFSTCSICLYIFVGILQVLKIVFLKFRIFEALSPTSQVLRLKFSEGGGGPIFSRGVGSFIAYSRETYTTCGFPGGSEPCRPLWIRPCQSVRLYFKPYTISIDGMLSTNTHSGFL